MKPIAVAYLLGSMREPPDGVADMQSLLGCSRATAYRWLKFLREHEAVKRQDERRIFATFSGWARHA